MNKPEWKDAPKWADYLTMDSDGWWKWHELEPHKTVNHVGVNAWFSRGKCKLVSCFSWEETLEKRNQQII